MALPWQTVLFVPADKPKMLRKAQTYGAAALMIDLEDAIAPGEKEAARDTLLEELAAGSLAGESRLYVRINAAGEGGIEDARALRWADIAGLMVPKVSEPADLEEVEVGLPLIPQVESAAGVLWVRELLAGAVGVQAAAFGGEDFSVDLGVTRSPESTELFLPRAWVSLCAHAAGVPAIDTVYTDLADAEGLEREARLAAQLGFAGKLLIHPAQIEVTATAFAPSQRQLDWAHRVLAAAAEAARAGAGVAVVDGSMVDPPVVAQAERIVAREVRGEPRFA